MLKATWVLIVAIGVLIGTLTLIFLIVQPMLGRLGKLSEDTISGLLASDRNSTASAFGAASHRLVVTTEPPAKLPDRFRYGLPSGLRIVPEACRA